MCVNNLPRVALDSVAAGIRTRDLLITSSSLYRYTTEPHIVIRGGKRKFPFGPSAMVKRTVIQVDHRRVLISLFKARRWKCH